MSFAWIILAAAALGQTTRPAEASVKPIISARPRISVAAPAANRVRATDRPTTQPASKRPTTQPVTRNQRARLEQAARSQFKPAATVADIGQLSGDRVEVEVTADGTVLLTGNDRDLEILASFIELMDQQQVVMPEFKIFALKSGDANDLAKKIEQFWNAAMKPITGQIRPEDRITIIPEPRAKILMVAATAENMDRIAQVIDDLDKPSISETVQFKRIRLKNIQAAEAEQMLQDMLKSLQQRLGVSKELVTIKADVRANTLLISAPEADLEQILHLIELIDIEVTAESGGVVKMAIYPLERAVAQDLADVLTEMLRADSDASKAMQEQIRKLQIIKKLPDDSEQTLGDLDLDKPIKVFAEKGTNSIIVATVEKNLEPVGELVRLLDSVPLADQMQINIYVLEHADVETVAVSLREMFDQGKQLPVQPGREEIKGRIPPDLTGQALVYNVGISGDKRTNTLIVSGRPEQLLLIKQIVGAIDVRPSIGRYTPRLVALEHADAKSIGEVVQQLADQRQKIIEATHSAAAAERERTLIIPDVRTNSLIIVGRDENFAEFARLAKELDGVEDDWLGQIRIINLENLTAADLADKIEDLWERRSEIRREGGLPEDKPVIVVDARSNSLVIASTQDDFDAIAGVVKKLEDQELSPMADIRLIALEHNDVGTVGEIITKLFEERLKMGLAEGQKEQPSDRIAVAEDPMTRTLLIASSKSNFDEIVLLVKKLDVPPTAEGLFRTFFVRNADISKAADLIQEIFDKGLYRGSAAEKDLPESLTKVTIVPDLRSSALIVSGSPSNLAVVELLLKEIDREEVPALPAGARLFAIEYADVVGLADTLEQMFEGMRASMTSDQQDQLEVKIIPETRSKTLIVTGARYALKRAEELVPLLDVEADDAAYSVEVYKLKEAAASQLEPVMTELFDERATQEQTGKRTPIHIMADDGSNSLIVTASQDDHNMVSHLLGLLDKKSTIAEQIHILPLAEAKADQVADMLSNLIDVQQGDRKGGFAVEAEERTNSLLIWAAPDLMANVRTIVQTLDNNQTKTELALRVFQLRNAKAEDLSEMLDEFFEKAASGKGDEARQMIIKFASFDPDTEIETLGSVVYQDITITADKNTNSLMVLAPQKHIDMMAMLVHMLDSVQPQILELRSFRLRNADATEMKDLLEGLFDTEGGGDDEQRQLVLGGELGGAVGGEGAALDLAFAVDERTNTLIAAGSESYLKNVERLVYQLDGQEIEERIPRVVQLRNRPSDEIAEMLSSYFEEESQIIEEAAEGESKIRRTQRQVTVQDGGEGSNTLLLGYNPRMESEVLNMIDELDRAPAMVMIQVLMVEVTLDERLEFGMEFALQDLLFSEKAVTGANGTLRGDNFDFIGGTDVGATGESPLGGFSFTMTGEDFNFLFRALQTEGRMEILSRPSIMAQDNQEASITVGEQVPVVTDVTISSGIAMPSVNYQDVGVILTVTPIVNPDGYVSMEISPEISAIGTSSISVGSGITLPTFTQRKAETTVTVRDGETIIIGGLITSRQNESESKVPLVGDIPILGNMFRATNRTSTKTELLLVLTPHVIRTPEDARALSLQMRDQTGLNDRIRNSPLMERLQVKPDEDQLGPDMLQPTGEQKPRTPENDLLGPEIEKLGPSVSTIEVGPDRGTIAVRSESSLAQGGR